VVIATSMNMGLFEIVMIKYINFKTCDLKDNFVNS
jgi:hypothetical protein